MKYGFGLPFRLLSGFNLVFEYFERTVTSDVSQEFFHVFSMKKYFKNCLYFIKILPCHMISNIIIIGQRIFVIHKRKINFDTISSSAILPFE